MKNKKLAFRAGENVPLDYTIDSKAVFVGEGAIDFVKMAVADFKDNSDNPSVSWISKDENSTINIEDFFEEIVYEIEKRLQYPEYAKYNNHLIVAEIEYSSKLIQYLKQTEKLPLEIGFIFYSENERGFESFEEFCDPRMFFRSSKIKSERNQRLFTRHSDSHNFKAVDQEDKHLYPDWKLGRLTLRHPEIFDLLVKFRSFGVNLIDIGLHFRGDFYYNIRSFERLNWRGCNKVYRNGVGFTSDEVEFLHIVFGIQEKELVHILKKAPMKIV